jgi:hypothetical protein
VCARKVKLVFCAAQKDITKLISYTQKKEQNIWRDIFFYLSLERSFLLYISELIFYQQTQKTQACHT